ncbi:MAG: hypothetical protein HY747_07395 [Elusimicrobia bacterium]|nr:hypothetical protein [Elusimicrobiota bacterium]
MALYKNLKYPYFLEYSQKVWKGLPMSDEKDGSFYLSGSLPIKPELVKKRESSSYYGTLVIYIRTKPDREPLKSFLEPSEPSETWPSGSTVTITTGAMTINGIDFIYGIEQGYIEFTEQDIEKYAYEDGALLDGHFCHVRFYTEKPVPLEIEFTTDNEKTTGDDQPSKDEEARRGVERLKQEALKVIKTFRWHEPKNSGVRKSNELQ